MTYCNFDPHKFGYLDSLTQSFKKTCVNFVGNLFWKITRLKAKRNILENRRNFGKMNA